MITYERTDKELKVILDGKHVGYIIANHGTGYVYRIKGSKLTGDTYPTIAAVKKSLEDHFDE